MRLQMLERRRCSKSAEQSCEKGKKSDVKMPLLPNRLLDRLSYDLSLLQECKQQDINSQVQQPRLAYYDEGVS
jgi:hypothetical protein